jgi:hypothetical protein
MDLFINRLRTLVKELGLIWTILSQPQTKENNPIQKMITLTYGLEFHKEQVMLTQSLKCIILPNYLNYTYN